MGKRKGQNIPGLLHNFQGGSLYIMGTPKAEKRKHRCLEQ